MNTEPQARHNSAPAGSTTWSYLRSRLFYRLFVIALPGLAAMFIVGIAGLGALTQLGGQIQIMQDALKTREVATRLVGRMDGLITNLNTLTVPGNQYNSEIYTQSRNAVLSDTAILEDLDLSFASGTTNQRTQVVAQLTTLFKDLDKMNSTDDPKIDSRFALWTGGLHDQATQANKDLHDLTLSWERAVEEVVQRAAEIFLWGQRGIPTLIVVALVATLGITILLTRAILRQISQLRVQMSRLATGDLTDVQIAPEQVKRNQNDELAALEGEYLRTIHALHPLIGRLQDDVVQLNTLATDLSSTATQQANSSTIQVTSITEISTTIEELTKTAGQISDAANGVASAAEQALASTASGQEAVRDSILAMAMIRSRVNDIIARILALSTQSQRISEIIDLIDEMAARTHILALNAAIESVGAGGEAGERFGVVASEVKKLAQRSAAATREVRLMISQVHAATNAAVMATEDGLKETEQGLQLAHRSGTANEGIIQMVEYTAQLASAIRLATDQQRAASEQIMDTIRNIGEVAQQTAHSGQQTLQVANDLGTIAGQLRNGIQGFRVQAVTESMFTLSPGSGA